MKTLSHLVLVGSALFMTSASAFAFSSSWYGGGHHGIVHRGQHGHGHKSPRGGGGGAPEPASMALVLAGASYLVGRKLIKKRGEKNKDLV